MAEAGTSGRAGRNQTEAAVEEKNQPVQMSMADFMKVRRRNNDD